MQNRLRNIGTVVSVLIILVFIQNTQPIYGLYKNGNFTLGELRPQDVLVYS